MGAAAVLSPPQLRRQFCGMYQLYIDYFEYLCSIHPQLMHSEENKVFSVISIEEAFAQFENPGTGRKVFFRLIDLSWRLGNDGGFNYYDCEGGFQLIVFFDKRNEGSSAQLAARSTAEKYATDFATHMMGDSRNGHPLFSSSIDELKDMGWNATPLLNTGDGSYDGLNCTFHFKKQLNAELACHSETQWQELSPFSYGDFGLNSGGAWQLNNEGNWQLG